LILSLINYLFTIFIGLFSFAFSIILFISALKKIGTVKTSVLFSTSPFIAALFSLFLLRESIGSLGFLIFILTFGGVILITTDKHAHLHSHGILVHTHPLIQKNEHHENIKILSKTDKSKKKNSVNHKHQEFTHSHNHSHDTHHRHEHNND
jgi:predicted membrane-bound spermidine synthase